MAWIPPAVAHAPIVTRVVVSRRRRSKLLELLVRADRALDEEDVERSGRAARGCLREFDDVEPLGDGEQVILEIEDGQLAAVARGELDDADPRSARRAPASWRATSEPLRRERGPSSARLNTGPSWHTKNRPSWQWPHRPTPHDMLRSSVTHVRSGPMPRAASTSDGGLHHPFRSADEGDGVAAVPGGAVEQLGHDPDAAEPVRPGPVHGLLHLDRAAGGETADLADEQPVGRSPGPRKSRIVPMRIALRPGRRR